MEKTIDRTVTHNKTHCIYVYFNHRFKPS